MCEIGLFPAEAGFNDPDALIKWELSHDDEAGVLSTSTNFVPLIISLLVLLASSLILRKKKRKKREEV